jgi:hypothetical protein
MFPFVGPSYTLSTRAADVQRSVNLYPAPIESGSGKSAYMLQSIPGLTVFCDDMTGEGRACFEINGRAFCVVGYTFYEILSDGTATTRGTLLTKTGTVDIDANSLEVFMVDGVSGYRLDLASNTFTQNTRVSEIGGSKRTAYLDQYAIYAPTGSAFFISSLAESGTIDDLDFASAEAAPDYLVSFLVCNRQLYLFGGKSTEIWINTGAADFPLQRYEGMVMSVGCAAVYTPRILNGAPVWVGSDSAGAGAVWMAEGYIPRRISTRAVEQALRASTDLSAATAYVQHWNGSYFYCLNLPGVDTTWCFDALTQSWHERAELTDGVYEQHRVIGCMKFAGSDMGLGSDGVLYSWSDTVYSNAGDTLCRERVSPHNATMDGKRHFFGVFEVDCDRGGGGVAMLRYSNDGGATWSDWRQRSLGATGAYRQRVLWSINGSARDRVWQLRCTDAVPFNVVHAFAES